jgi:NADH dehydrogenase
VHLAALTGKGTADAHRRATVEGTDALLGAAKDAGVSRFVFVSTIAVRYPEKKSYPYARAKETAEQRVKDSGLDWTIVRPTLVFGEGSPIQDSLAGLAQKPFTPLFGNGRTQVQPIAADDVARAIADVVEDPSTIGAEIDLGGPDRLSFDELMQKMRTASGRKPGPLVHLPVGITSAALSLLEPLLLWVLPVTAGQLYAFRYDSTAEPTPFLEARLPSFAGIDRMLNG